MIHQNKQQCQKFHDLLEDTFPDFEPARPSRRSRRASAKLSFCPKVHVKSQEGHWSSVRPVNHGQDPALFITSEFDNFKTFESKSSKSNAFPLIWDSGASVCVSNCKQDFISFSSNPSIASLGGYAKGQEGQVQGEGQVLWSIEGTDGVLRTLKLKAFYLPSCKVRLISTSAVLSTYSGETFTIDKDGGKLSGIPNCPTRRPIFAQINKRSNLIVSIGHRYGSQPQREVHVASIPSMKEQNHNLSVAEKELLRWHERLGHISFRKVQHLMRLGVLSSSVSAKRLHTAAAKLKAPKCAACIYAKQKVRSAPGRTTSIQHERSGVLRKNNLLPGQEVSVDHFICSQQGRLFTSRGRSADKDMFCGGCLFIDHASNFVHVEFQKVLTSHATINSKLSFEDFCRDHGVVASRYLSDNGSAFTSTEYSDHLSTFEQITRFAGVGAHHHNGHAERAIQTIMSISRAMMIHSGMHWPDVCDSSLCVPVFFSRCLCKPLRSLNNVAI